MARMMQTSSLPADETGFDQVVSFSLSARGARGRVVRLGPALDTILSAHAYPPVVRNLLAEALVITALMGSLLKEEGSQITLQAQAGGGAVDLLVCDYRDGQLRGHARHDPDRIAGLGANADLPAIFGEGYLAVTFDLPVTGERYQGIVPLEGASLAAACESYFRQSEQVPTLLRVAMRSGPGGVTAGGLLLQHLPEGEAGRERLHARMDHPEWEHVAVLGASLRHDELLDPALSMEAMIWRLFHEEDEVRVVRGPLLQRGCRCSIDHYRSILLRFPEEERTQMRNDQGQIVVDCAFCSRDFTIDA